MKQVIIGRSGSGKTSYIIERIKEDLKAGYENILVIVPDQFTFETERELIKVSGSGLFEIRVLSFRRLIDALRDELGTKGCLELDEVNKAMYVNKLLYDYSSELSVYKGAYRTPSFSYDMAKAITECKQFGVEYGDLESLEFSGKTRDKLLDIAQIYKAYSNFRGGFKDNEDIINIITGRIKGSRHIQGARIYIDHFDVFTHQGYAMIEEMAKVCRGLCVCLCTDENSRGLFSLTTQTLERIRQVVPGIETITLEKENLSSDIGFLEANLFEQNPSKKDGGDGSVELFSFTTVISEVDHAVAKIIQLKNQGYKYMDICLMTGGLDEYGPIVEQTLSDCKIPYFVDEKTPLINSRLAKFLIYSLKNCYTFEAENYIGMLKQGILLENMEDVHKYENYIIGYGLKKALVPIQDDAVLDNVRESIKIPTLRKTMEDAVGTKDMAEAVLDYFTSFEITFEDAIEERCYNKLINVLERMSIIFLDTPMDVPLFASILTTGISSVSIGLIPEKKDSVIVGDISRTKIEKTKCLLVLGVRDGGIPKITQKSGLISDYDSAIIGQQIKLGRDSFDLNNLEQLLTYKMLSKPSDYLYLSHSQRSLYGAECYNKMMFSKVKDILNIPVNMNIPFNEEMNLRLLASKTLAFKNLMADAFSGENNYITRGVMGYFRKTTDIDSLLSPKSYDLSITREEARDIYEGSKISASRIETYNECAFRQFITYGLRVLPRKVYEINNLDTGSLFHSIVEEFSKTLIDKTKDTQNSKELYNTLEEDVLSGNMVENIVQQRLEEDGLSIYGEDNIGKVMAKRIVSTCKSALGDILLELRDSNFSMTYTEKELRELGDYKIEGRPLVGRIDRVDVGENAVSIIDYKKSSSATMDYTKIYGGIQLQLLLYMQAVMNHFKETGKKEITPYAIEYYSMEIGYEKCDSLNKFINGTGGNRASVLAVGQGKSDLSYEQMEQILNFGERIAKGAVRSIYNGDISISPYAILEGRGKNACEYCAYSGICKNKDMSNKRLLEKATLDDILGGEDDE